MPGHKAIVTALCDIEEISHYLCQQEMMNYSQHIYNPLILSFALTLCRMKT